MGDGYRIPENAEAVGRFVAKKHALGANPCLIALDVCSGFWPDLEFNTPQADDDQREAAMSYVNAIIAGIEASRE